MIQVSAADAFRVMKELHHLLLSFKLLDDAKEYWSKVFAAHGMAASWEGKLEPATPGGAVYKPDGLYKPEGNMLRGPQFWEIRLQVYGKQGLVAGRMEDLK